VDVGVVETANRAVKQPLGPSGEGVFVWSMGLFMDCARRIKDRRDVALRFEKFSPLKSRYPVKAHYAAKAYFSSKLQFRAISQNRSLFFFCTFL